LSNSSASRGIDELASDVEKQLLALLQVKNFAMQIDECCSRDHEALPVIYVRFMDNNQLREEMIFLESS
jgi:hypothetical protein